MPLIRNFKVIFLKYRSDFGLATVVNFGEEALKVTGNGAAVKNIYILHNAPLHLCFFGPNCNIKPVYLSNSTRLTLQACGPE